MLSYRYLFSFLIFCLAKTAASQATIEGYIFDEFKNPLEFVDVVENRTNFTTTNELGYFSLKISHGIASSLSISYQNKKIDINIPALAEGAIWKRSIVFNIASDISQVNVIADKFRKSPSVFILKPKDLKRFPNPSGSIESFIKTLPGVASGNELSSALSVRGGNFDENLIYVNGFEIYRPQLIRSGQQEGMSFINPDLVENIKFSAGGFTANYGDKLSSVLDIQYKIPKKKGIGAEISFLGGSLFGEYLSKDNRLSVIGGLRYRTNQYLLNSLDVQGTYAPKFFDFQLYSTYRLNKKVSFNWLSNISNNLFLLLPQSQETSFGTFNQALKLFVAFGGQEKLQYQTIFNGINLDVNWSDKLHTTFFSTQYISTELEYFTVEGAYRLDQLENNLGSDDFGESAYILGLGYFIDHGRNRLNTSVNNLGFRGSWTPNLENQISWGGKLQFEEIEDKLKEWRFQDSAGYNISKTNSEEINLDELLISKNTLSSQRKMAFIQHKWALSKTKNANINYGLRANHWTLNNQLFFSPRINFSFEPNKAHNDFVKKNFKPQQYDSLFKQDWVLKFAFGLYHQPAFYRELRDLEGNLIKNKFAQRSTHFVLGGDRNFVMWGRKFKFFGEAYYKHLNNMIPYLIDNVRIRYLPNQSSKGYASGIDARINGQFIPELESWLSVGILSTQEKITYQKSGTSFTSPYLRRPTDQRINFSLLFQDELKKNENFKMHMNISFGSGLPYFFSGENRYNDLITIPAYRRVDMGMSKEVDINKLTNPHIKRFQKIWMSLELYNMLDFNNTISYVWVKDIQNRTYGVPNYLTGRRLNFRISLKW